MYAACAAYLVTARACFVEAYADDTTVVEEFDEATEDFCEQFLDSTHQGTFDWYVCAADVSSSGDCSSPDALEDTLASIESICPVPSSSS